MASITKKPYGTFEVQWTENKKRRSKSFRTKREAREFAVFVESSATEKKQLIKFGDLLKLYRDSETIKKRGARSETIRINKFLTWSISDKFIGDLTKKDFQALIDSRLETPAPTGGTLSPATVKREFTTINTVLNFAIRLGYLESNPATGVQFPKMPEHRERVASEEEQERIIVASGWDGQSPPENKIQLVALAFIFSCRTGMRSGEILQIVPSWIDGDVIHLPKEATKTATKRDVALSSDAQRLLNLVKEMKGIKKDCAPRLFSDLTDHNRDALWRKIRNRADLGPVYDEEGNLLEEGLNFHDGRATFATWAASPDPKTGAPRLDVLALARQTGHRDLKMLQRYYRESAHEIAKRLG